MEELCPPLQQHSIESTKCGCVMRSSTKAEGTNVTAMEWRMFTVFLQHHTDNKTLRQTYGVENIFMAKA